MKKEIQIALLQEKDRGSRELNLERTLSHIDQASEQGADIICTKELFLSPYFCQTENEKYFSLAEEIDANCETLQVLQEAAAKNTSVLIASLFEKTKTEYYNTTVVIEADGTYLGKYRKMHIPEDPQFHEKYYFSEGDLGPKVFETRYGKIGVLVCWDQWFPEAARLTALKGAEILFYPTSIGYLPGEKESLGDKYEKAWQMIQQSHAIANCRFVAAVNRVGFEKHPDNPQKGIQFWGKSFIADPYGQLLAEANDAEQILMAKIDLNEGKEMETIWPFYRDRRTDLYKGLLEK